ncbi:MAG: AAA family ATPase [Nitrososphaerota archaeon]|nr:AAA family ATPase [Nitrososphaerota archaeon]
MSSESVHDLLRKSLSERAYDDLSIVLEGQYKKAYELLSDATSVDPPLPVLITGPPGVGKSLLVRKFALDTERSVYEIFFDEIIKPQYLVGSHDPAMVLKSGYSLNTFDPGPLVRAMIDGGIFLAQEINRASPTVQNSLHEPLEERSYHLPRIGRIRAKQSFALIATANPAELSGVYKFTEALRDRLRVTVELTYPDRETELKIMKLNSPYRKIPEEIYYDIYSIIRRTREMTDRVKKPASVRVGPAIAKLVAQRVSRGEDPHVALREVAPHVLASIEVTSTENKNHLIKEIVENIGGD